jgi:hypothetical protein
MSLFADYPAYLQINGQTTLAPLGGILPSAVLQGTGVAWVETCSSSSGARSFG